MAIINCKHCGGKVSDKAKACPHCGKLINQDGTMSTNTDSYQSGSLKVEKHQYPKKKKSALKPILAVVGILLLLYVAIIAFGYIKYEVISANPVHWEKVIKAEQGDEWEQYLLGYDYANGAASDILVYVPQNYTEAVKWYRKAAEQGHADAQLDLSYCYYNGCGVPQDYDEALKWNRNAAEQGIANAQYNMGILYLEGHGVPQNTNMAIEWFQKAAEQGHAYAQYNLGNQYFGVDIEKAVEWYQKAAEQGLAEAQNKLAWCYLKGFGVTEDTNKALEWFQKAADQGNEEAKDMLQRIDN